MSHLNQEHQALLLLTYRDHLDQRTLSEATGLGLRDRLQATGRPERPGLRLDRLDLL